MTRMRKNMMSKLYIFVQILPFIIHDGLARWTGSQMEKVSFVYFRTDALLLYLSFHIGDSRVSMCTSTLIEKPEKREGRAQLPWAGNPSRGSLRKEL